MPAKSTFNLRVLSKVLGVVNIYETVVAQWGVPEVLLSYANRPEHPARSLAGTTQVIAIGSGVLALLLLPEASSFTRARFGSTSPLSPAGPPRLRITYLLPFPFENP